MKYFFIVVAVTFGGDLETDIHSFESKRGCEVGKKFFVAQSRQYTQSATLSPCFLDADVTVESVKLIESAVPEVDE